MKTLMIAAALCAGIVSAQAQGTPTDKKTTPPDTKTSTTGTQKPATQVDNKDCLMTTDAEWKTLGLTAEQITQVKSIQDEHKTACAGMKKDDVSTAVVSDEHEERIKNVLTPTKYDSWKKSCTAMATPGNSMEKK